MVKFSDDWCIIVVRKLFTKKGQTDSHTNADDCNNFLGEGDYYYSAYGNHSPSLLQVIFNPLLPSAHKSARIDTFSILKLKRTIKKFL